MTALPFSDYIDQASSGSTQFKTLISRYGNGYEQRAPDGLNNNLASWSVTWNGLSSTDFTSLVSSIDTAQGVNYFTWVPPGASVSKKWVVEQYSISTQGGQIYSVSGTLRQVADLT